jgi:hypothetical protein
MHLQEQLVFPDHRLVDVPELKDVSRAVSVLNDRFHAGWPQIIRVLEYVGGVEAADASVVRVSQPPNSAEAHSQSAVGRWRRWPLAITGWSW